MKKIIIYFIVFCMLVVSMSSSFATYLEKPQNLDKSDINSVIELDTFEKTKSAVEKYKIMGKSDFQPYNELNNKQITVPWTNNYQGDILEWYIRIVYNGKEFYKEVPITIRDFQEKFLKHPEYGEKIKFNVDSDSQDDLEVIIGFYRSIIKRPDGSDAKSLETRFRVRTLETGNYIEDSDGELEVWSELHVNWGLVKETAKSKQTNSFLENLYNKLLDFRNNYKFKIFNLIFDKFSNFFNRNIDTSPEIQPTDVTDSDYFSIGAGYRSPAGEQIPRYTEKRFAFARDKLFSPSIFQHKMDPGSATGKDPFELLYGFRSFEASTDALKYDIEFSVEFDPAVYLITKFVPVGGYVYYYFDQKSRRSSDTRVTFASNILKGSGEDTTVSLVFDKIDDSLGSSGRWMMFDIDLIDFDPLGGKFKYEASHKFDVGVIVNSPGFNEKVQVKGVPKRADISWDVDLSIRNENLFKTDVSGFAECSMSSDLNEIIVYYPRTDENDPLEEFIDIRGIPSVKVGGEAKLHIDLGNFGNPSNYIYGNIYQSSSSSLDNVDVFLKEIENPFFSLSNPPANADAEAGVYWNKLQGFAKGYTSSGANMQIGFEYGGFKITDTLGLKSGHIKTDFKIANSGYVGLDTSNDMLSNDLYFYNSNTGDEITLSIGKVDADNFWLDWELDSSGGIKDLGFRGIISVLRDLQLNLKYSGRNANLELGWVLGSQGFFDVFLDQENDLTIDFSQFAPESNVYDLTGSLVISDNIDFDMSWMMQQGSGTSGGAVNPGFFVINENTRNPNFKHFDFEFIYQDKYGISVNFDNLKFYLRFEWWKGQRVLPYVWLDYNVNVENFDVDLLWTNGDGETQWYYNVEDWV